MLGQALFNHLEVVGVAGRLGLELDVGHGVLGVVDPVALLVKPHRHPLGQRELVVGLAGEVGRLVQGAGERKGQGDAERN